MLDMKTPNHPRVETNDEDCRCVILLHQIINANHWDLMLEVQNALWTWRLDQLPAINHTVLGERITDHRIHYLDYEGPVANNRGTVKRVRTGHYRWEPKSKNRLAVLQFENEIWNVLLENENSMAKISRTS